MSKLDESPIERVLRVCSEHTIISDAEGDAALAELAALRERVARHETIASASTAATLDALFDPIHDAAPCHGLDCSQNGGPDCCPEHLAWLNHCELVTKAYNFAVGLMERIAKLEAVLVKADDLRVAAISATWPDLGDVPTSSQEWVRRFMRVKDASATYRAAREAAK